MSLDRGADAADEGTRQVVRTGAESADRSGVKPGLLLYGVLDPKDESPALDAARTVDPSTRLVEAAGLACLVGYAPDLSDKGSRERLMSHFGLLQAVGLVADVLPARFGMVLPNEDAVRQDLLAAKARPLARRLERLRGHLEMRVRMSYRRDDVLREIVRGNPVIRRLNDRTQSRPPETALRERIELGRRIASAIDRRRAEERPRILRRLRGIAVDVRMAPPATEMSLFAASFLVHRSRVDEFVAETERIVEDHPHSHLTVVGPIPPWTFVDIGSRPSGAARTT
jgi:hypothetical protein